MKDGRTPETAFVIKDSSGEMTQSIGDLIDSIFGSNDGSYFVHSETTMENKKDGVKYKVLFVEDSKGLKHQVYFKIS